MTYNANWPRWVQASIGKHFKTALQSKPYPLLIEGIDERLAPFMEATNRVELRINGPHIIEKYKGGWHFIIDVNILVFSHMGGKLPNAYDGINIAGEMARLASDTIPIFKLGAGVFDDQSLIGCLALRQGSKESVHLHHFGEIDRENRLREFGIDANYEMWVHDNAPVVQYPSNED